MDTPVGYSYLDLLVAPRLRGWFICVVGCRVDCGPVGHTVTVGLHRTFTRLVGDLVRAVYHAFTRCCTDVAGTFTYVYAVTFAPRITG